MKKRIFKLSLKAIVAFFVLSNVPAFAQTQVCGEDFEKVAAHWGTAMKGVRNHLGLSKEDFKSFVNFYRQKNDSLRNGFRRKIMCGAITEKNVGEYLAFITSQEIYLYKQYQQVRKEYPSSVGEYSTYNKGDRPYTTCNPGCTNVDFSNGTLSGWNAYYASNISTSSSTAISPLTGGPCGAVTAAANDPNSNSGIPPILTPDYQVEIMSGGNDPLAPSVPRVYPFGSSKYSVRVGDSTNPYSGVAVLNQTFMVTAANANFTYDYAIFLDNPPHLPTQEPFFNAVLLNSNGDTISKQCQNYNVTSNNAGQNGFDSVFYRPRGILRADSAWVTYKNWTSVFADLNPYIGQCITIQFTTADCAPGGHFAYAYVSASCSNNGFSITSSSPLLCGQKYITLTAPQGASQYLWSGPAKGIISSDTTQSIKIDSAGTYQVILTPYGGGKACADTLTITIKKGLGLPPIPSFTADTVCAGSATQFINTSIPLVGPGISYYWSFYSNGVINDSATSPNWAYSQPGIYNVQLNEINNGCGVDTIIQVKVDSMPVAAFRDNNTCANQTVTFTNQSTGATSYTWYFGNGSTSNAVNPTTTYTVAGTYTVSLVASDRGKCKDSISKTITINALPVITITSTSTIVRDTITMCPGNKVNLTAAGGFNYSWQPGNIFGKTITVSPTSTTTYTVSARNGSGCTGEDSITIVVLPIVTLTLTTTPDTICQGNSSTLNVSGGTSTYTWAPNTSLSASTGAGPITATPTTTITYTVTAAGTNGCSAKDSATVTVFGPGALAPKVTLSSDSNCPGTNITLTATGASTFTWGNGATTSSIVVAPLNSTNAIIDTVVTVIAHSSCRAADTTINVKVYVEPVPNPVISGNDSICRGSSTVLTVSSTVGAPGYLWQTTTDRTDTLTVAPNKQTTYTVIAANGGCTKQATFTVSIRPQPNVKGIASHDTICAGTSDTLTGLGANTYTWTPATSLNTSSGSPVVASPTITTTYTVTGASSAGCTATSRVRVIVISTTINVAADSLSRDSLCPGSVLTIFATGAYNPGYTYTWSSGASANVPPNSANVGPTTIGKSTFTLTVSNRCASKQVVDTVYVEPRPVITMSASQNPVCAGAPVTLTATSNDKFSGILWLNSTPPNSHNGTIVVNPTTQTTYTVEAANAYCVASDTLTVGIRPSPNGKITGQNTTCPGEPITLYAAGGGTYKWFNGSTADTIVVSPTSAINAYVLVSNGCIDSVAYPVTIKPAPSIWACCDTTIELGGTASIGVTGGVSWQWEPSATVGKDTVAFTTATPSVNTTYTVTLKGANGCTYRDSVIVDIACHDLIVPNVFTPELVVTSTTPDDNIFLIKGVNPGQPYHIEIYNRWGAPVFTSTNPDDSWNGKDKSGTLVATGVYYYIITTTCGGKNYNSHGYVQVIRNK